MLKRENQYTIGAWADSTFGQRSLDYRARMVLEEAVELAMATSMVPQDILNVVAAVIVKTENQNQPGLKQEEASDVLSCLYAYAHTAGFDLHTALDIKQEQNLQRPKSYYEEKQKRKAELGII